MSLFGLVGERIERRCAIENAKECFCEPAVGPRAQSFAKLQKDLLSRTSGENTSIVAPAAVHTLRNWAGEENKECLRRILSHANAPTRLEALDEQNITLWQLNWVEVARPVDDTIVAKNGERLWFKTTIRDVSGWIEVWVDEASALALSQLPNKEAFLQCHREGKKCFL